MSLPLEAQTDVDLLRRMASGDERAFTALYRRRQASVYRYALHMSGKPELAEEVTQEVFMALIREPRQYDSDRGELSAYLYGMARNMVRKALIRDRAYVTAHDEPYYETAGDDDVLGDLTRQERLDALRQAVLALPANYREAVVLCDLHEMDYAQASDVLGVPLGTVRSRLHRGRALLMEKMRVAHAPGVPRSQSCERLIGNQVYADRGHAGQEASCGPGGPPHSQSVRVISNDA
jgi:RNA polymerase sigma-70 factor (ECF subfamily)